MLFTPEELEEMRRADEEIEATYRITSDEIAQSRARDAAAILDRKDHRGRRAAKRQSAYREANRERIAERQSAYREANRERIAEYKKAYYEANRERIAERQKDLLRSFRKGKSLSQKQFGAMLGVRQQTISFWETGSVPANITIIGSVFPDLMEALKEAGA